MAITKISSKKYGYTYQVDVRYKDEQGVSQRHVKSGFKTKKEAKEYEASIIDKAKSMMKITGKTDKTINDVYKEYMEVEGENKYVPTTKIFYNRMHKLYVEKEFGRLPINKITYSVAQDHINDISKTRNYPTIFNIKKIYAITFKYATRVGYIKDNPIPYVIIPNKIDRKEVKTISDEDLNKIIDSLLTIKNNCVKKAKFTYQSYAVALYIGSYTGLRISEVLALKKEDFDLDNYRLTVQRRVEYSGIKAKDNYLSGILKTKSSKATVEISSKLCKNLEKWFEYNPYDLVVCDKKGNILNPGSFQDRIRRVTKELGIDFHYHMLRHTYATELMMGDINPIVVRDLLRHSQVNTTWNVYTHSNIDHQKNVLEEIYKEDMKGLEIDFSMDGFQIK